MSSDQLRNIPPGNAPAIEFPPVTAQKWTLPNGLTIIVQIDRSAPVASVQAWCGTGSIDEGRHLGSGLSHILEHMLFKGTKTRTTNAIAQSIQNEGGYINAYTSFDRTVYWVDVPKEGVASALDILSDAMMNSTLPVEEYVKEQEVIRREFAMGYDDPDRMVGQIMFKTAYQRHPYRLPVIGEIQIFDQLTQQDVADYYRNRYVPNNLTFVVVGDVDAGRVYAQIAQYFTAYPARALEQRYVPQEPPQQGRREGNDEFATELSRLALAWHVPEITHPDVPAVDLLSTILGDGRSSRLYRRVREEAGLVFGISAFSYTPGDPGLLGIDAALEPQNRVEAEHLILRIVSEMRQTGVTAEELAKAKKISLGHSLGSLTTMRGQASDLGSNWFGTRNLNFTRDYLKAMQKVSLVDLKRIAAKYLVDDNLTVVSLNPRGTLTTKATEAKLVSAGEVEKFELGNGLRLLVREDGRLPLISMVAVFRGGLLAETPETSGLTRLMAKVLVKGTKSRSAEQIADAIEAVGGSLGSDAGNNSFSVSLEVTRPDLRLGAELLCDVLLNATMPEKAVAREKEVQLASIRDDEEQLTTVARNILRAALFRHHPYALRAKGTPTAVARLTRPDLLAFRDRHLVAQNGVISVFGDVNALEMKQLFAQIFAGMKPGELALTSAPPPPQLAKIVTVEEKKEKTQAVLMVGYRGSDMFSPDRYALELINEASSDLGSRFFVKIREEMGLAYYVGASQMQGLVPGLFAFYLGTDPDKLELVQRALLDEIAKLASTGLTSDELARAKKKLIGQQRIANQGNDSFGYMSALDELYGLGFDHYKKLEAAIESITVDDVRGVAGKYFRQPYVLATVRPECKV
ncbi:MAG: M16 family metallopeptidase [Chthoniobacterales bacterium]